MPRDTEFYQKILNYVYMNMSSTAASLPFSGRYWLEQITRGVGERILKDYGLQPGSGDDDPLAVCNSYLELLGQAGNYRLTGKGEQVLVSMQREGCLYQDFCREAEEARLFFHCPRLGALQAALKQALEREYSTAVEFDRETGTCQGRIFPARRRLKTEMINREGDILRIAGERAVLFTRDMYGEILAAIHEYAPHIMKTVLFEAGYRSSRPIAEQTKEGYLNPLEALTSLFGEFSNVGLGSAELVSLDPDQGRAVVRCYGSVEVEIAHRFPIYRTPRVVCDLLRGKFSAYLSVILERPIICEEMKCASMGEAYCEFHAFPADPEGVIR